MALKSSFSDLNIPSEPLPNLLFSKILQYGDKSAMIDTTEQKMITFKEIYDRARKCASSLHKQGLKHGDIVGICAPSCTEFPVVTLAILACGATVTTINPAYKEGEVIQQFTISEPRMVFASEEALVTVKKVSKKISSIQKIFVIGENAEFTTVRSLIDSGSEEGFPRDVPIDVYDDVALLVYSSGTTGMPKSVMLHHHSLVSSLTITNLIYGGPDTCFYTDRPMFHLGGMLMLLLGLHSGIKLVQEQVFDVDRMLQSIEKHKVTHALAVPPMMISLLQTPNFDKYDTSSLKQLEGGGASVAPALITDLEKRYKVKVRQGYGMTEALSVAYQFGDNVPINSVGKIAHNTAIKIADVQTGQGLGPNKHGEILVQGPQEAWIKQELFINFVALPPPCAKPLHYAMLPCLIHTNIPFEGIMKGYLKNHEATSETIDEDGWLHTGDIGYYDESEFLYVVDRLKEVIKYKTFQVPPAEIESVLLKHPKIADVGVIGIPDEYAGEIPMAFVVKSDQSLTTEDVTKFVEGELVDYKHLRGGVQFTDVIPKSVQGKIQRKELKKMAEACLK